MKQLARKPRHISLVPPTAEKAGGDSAATSSLTDFFDGWLTSVTPKPGQPGTSNSTSQIGFGNRPLTTTDVMRVNRATVRESTDHRHWPPEVVQTFMSADVIKRKGGK